MPLALTSEVYNFHTDLVATSEQEACLISTIKLAPFPGSPPLFRIASDGKLGGPENEATEL